ncbi:hypothetical protein CYMTET_8254 [Cymbomonas tetramitiformis]|uniref:Uncharacterized protein n=1 Tax=Cymbomonas tetramitiformis TaxID=36881 RepID=A0AAE0GTU5_9CHLO|nr:hypothetical protein CYMTET_8254 [Cymbomonas tetramitiformis]
MSDEDGEAEEGQKGGGMFTALAGDEVDRAAIKETATKIRRGELSNAVQLDEDEKEDEKFKGQFRFLKMTGKKYANIPKKEGFEYCSSVTHGEDRIEA